MDFLCLYFLLFISIFLHELSHYITSKVYKVPVYIFSIGSGPLFFSFNLFETHFQIRFLPISGFIYSDDTEFNNLSLLKKYIIILSGITSNFLLFLIALLIILEFDFITIKYYVLAINQTISNVFAAFTLDSLHLAEQNFSYLFYGAKNYNSLTALMIINIILAISNIIPITPFDGSKVWSCTIEHVFSNYKITKYKSKIINTIVSTIAFLFISSPLIYGFLTKSLGVQMTIFRVFLIWIMIPIFFILIKLELYYNIFSKKYIHKY